MDALKNMWDASKGKIAVAGVVFLLGIPAVGTFLGIGVVDGPDGAVCFAPTQVEATTQ